MHLLFPTMGMLAILTVAAMSTQTVWVLAPKAAPDIGVPATYIGLFTAIVYVFAMVSGVMTGAFIFRYGAIRVCQFTMLSAAAGMVALTFASPVMAIVSAVLLGLAYGPFNPASGHVLANVSAPKWRPLIFSVKQAGVPMGGALAGAAVPHLVGFHGWSGAAWIVGAIALVVMAAVQPLRSSFDAGRKPSWPLTSASVLKPLRLVFTDPVLRKFSIAGFAYAGCQVCVGAFFVVYLVEALGASLVQAGVVFAFVQAGGVVGRVLWGLIANRWLSTHALLVGLGLMMAACIAGTAAATPSWPQSVITVLGFVLGTSSFGWVGVYLSEIARLAPEGKVGEATGGVQFIYFAGVVVVPPIFGLLVNFTRSYTVSFLGVAALAVMTGIYLMSFPGAGRTT